MNTKAIGATLLISGTMLGAGMLALPLISAGLGIGYTTLLLVVVWLVMTYTGLMMLEVCLNYPVGTGFDAIAESLYGKKGKWIVNGSLLLLLYSLSCAYISGGSSAYRNIINSYFHLSVSSHTVAIGFTVLIGLIVFISTRLVDNVNRVLFSANIIIFFLLIITVHPFIHSSFLINKNDSAKYALSALPVFLTAFGFHGSIPSMVKYLGKDKPKTLRNVFVTGGLIPIIVYIIWEVSTLGSLPRFGEHSFEYVAQHGSSVGVMIQQMHDYIKSSGIIYFISIFSAVAMFTSYLCVSLGLFDGVASTLKQTNSTKGRLVTALLTYIPPLIFTLVYPNGFVSALGAAAIFLTILAILFPVMSLAKIHKQKHQENYNLISNKFVSIVVGCSGILVIICQLLTLNHAIPIF